MRLITAGLAAAVATLSCGATAAQEAKVAVNVAVASDYVFRGFSQTDSDPALQAGVDVTVGAIYVGAWASNVDFGDETDAEIDLYGGVRGENFGYAWDVGVVGYLYTNADSAADYDYAELKAAVSRSIGPVGLTTALYYSPDFFGADDEAVYLETAVSFSPAQRLTLSAAYGRQYLDVNDDYSTWNLGVGYALTDNLALDVRYFDTDVDSSISDDRIVGLIKAVF